MHIHVTVEDGRSADIELDLGEALLIVNAVGDDNQLISVLTAQIAYRVQRQFPDLEPGDVDLKAIVLAVIEHVEGISEKSLDADATPGVVEVEIPMVVNGPD